MKRTPDVPAGTPCVGVVKVTDQYYRNESWHEPTGYRVRDVLHNGRPLPFKVYGMFGFAAPPAINGGDRDNVKACFLLRVAAPGRNDKVQIIFGKTTVKQWQSGALPSGPATLCPAEQDLADADRRAFVGKLHIGYEKDIVLLPVYANLSPPILFQALILKGIQPHAWETSKLIWRVLKAGEPDRADLASVTGSNWCNIVAYDEWQECCLGAKAWQKAILHELRQPELSASVCVNRLQTWPPALLRLNRARIYKDDFLETVVRALQDDARRVQEFLAREGPSDVKQLQAACALYNAGACLHGLEESEKWRRAAATAILKYLEEHQKPDGTLGEMPATLAAIESIMPPLAIAYRAGLPPPGDELAARLQNLLEFLVYTLDMYGCVPFADPDL